MAQELIQVSLCDVCLTESDTRTPEAQSFSVAIGIGGGKRQPASVAIELCEEHGQVLRAVSAFVTAYGRSSNGRALTPRSDREPGTFRCPAPDCAHVAPNQGALRSHTMSAHGQRLVTYQVPAALMRLECPVCGDRFAKGQGAAAHLRARHPEDWQSGVRPTKRDVDAAQSRE